MRSVVTGLVLAFFVVIVASFAGHSIAADAATATQPRAADPLIVFSSNRGGAWAIWAVKPDGTQLQQLTKPAAGEQDVDPAFNADGSRILFTSTRGGKAGLWQMARDGSDAKRICDGDQGAWSPDGRRIVLRRGGKLLTRDLASEKEKVISPEDWDKCSGPAWSPDGASIAFAKLGENSNAVYVIPA